KRIQLNTISLQTFIWHSFKRHRQPPRLLAQRLWQLCQRRLNLNPRQVFQSIPVHIHAMILTLPAPQLNYFNRFPQKMRTFSVRVFRVFSVQKSSVTSVLFGLKIFIPPSAPQSILPTNHAASPHADSTATIADSKPDNKIERLPPGPSEFAREQI